MDKFDDLMYEAGLTAQGCWDMMDEYDKEAILRFAELIVLECARLARNTNLEDVEGGDSAVLLAAKHHILDHFGVDECENSSSSY